MSVTPEIIAYDNPVLLVGGGQTDPDVLKEFARRGYTLVAADGGADTIAECGLVPAAIIGDLDSLKNRSAWERRSQVIELTEQDSTDFEKCLYATDAPFYFAIGFMGHRFDHTLAALHVLSRYADQKKVVMIDQVDALFPTVRSFKMKMKIGERMSVYPLAKVTFSGSQGLRFPLHGLVMEQGQQIGTSNTVISADVEITPEDGNANAYLVVISLAHLDDLISSVCAA